MVRTFAVEKKRLDMSLEVTWQESFMCRSLEHISQVPKHFTQNAGKGTTLKRASQKETQAGPVDRRTRFVKFCHGPPVVDQQGGLYPY